MSRPLDAQRLRGSMETGRGLTLTVQQKARHKHCACACIYRCSSEWASSPWKSSSCRCSECISLVDQCQLMLSRCVQCVFWIVFTVDAIGCLTDFGFVSFPDNVKNSFWAFISSISTLISGISVVYSVACSSQRVHNKH